MNEYKINIVYNNELNINDIFIKVLKREIEIYLVSICKERKEELTSSSTYLSLKEGGKNWII